MQKNILMISLVGLLSACSGGGGGGGSASNPPQIIFKAAVKSQPTSQMVVNTIVANGPVFSFLDSQNNVVDVSNKVFDISAYKDSNCVIKSTNHFDYSISKSGNLVTLTNLKYAAAEDFYIGIKGDAAIVGACSQKVSVASAMPVYFNVISGSGQSAIVSKALANPIVVQIMDINDHPVSNMTVRIDNYVSSASDSQGYASINYTVGNTAGTFFVEADLEFQGQLIHWDDTIEVIAVPDQAVSIEIAEQDDPMSFQVNDELADPIALQAFDSLGNVIYPSNWTLNWEVYSDPSCTVRATGGAFPTIEDSASSIDPNDTSTWLQYFFLSYDTAGDIYLRFSLGNNVSVCSNKISVTP